MLACCARGEQICLRAPVALVSTAPPAIGPVSKLARLDKVTGELRVAASFSRETPQHCLAEHGNVS
jgi:hypothetical protein